MSISDWWFNLIRQAYAEGDVQRIWMYYAFEHGYDLREDNPDEAIQWIRQSRNIAASLGEAWWVQMMNHWELQMLLFFKRDYTDALDLAVKATVEVRKPQYQGFPQRVCLHEDLINTYRGRDPWGYRELIQAAIAFMSDAVTPDIQCYQCLQSLKIAFALDLERLPQAREQALQLQAICQERRDRSYADYHLASTYVYLCEIAHKTQACDDLRTWAELGEPVARRADDNHALMRLLIWQAVAHRYDDNEAEAGRLSHLASVYARNYGAGPGAGYYTALAVFHEMGDDLELALQTYEQQLDTLVNTAQYYRECLCRLEIIRLRKALGYNVDEVISGLEAVMHHMKDAAHIRKKLLDYGKDVS